MNPQYSIGIYNETEPENYNSFNQEIFISTKDHEQFICEICLNVPNPVNAVQENNCGKIFCENCLEGWEKTGNKACPNCRKDIKKEKLKEINQDLYKKMQQLKVICPNKCDFKGSFENFIQHIKDCKLKQLCCRYQKIGCNFKGTKEDLIKHEKENMQYHLDLSLECTEKVEKIIKGTVFKQGNKYKVTCHEHELEAIAKDNGWLCNCSRFGKCEYNLNDFYLSNGIQRYRCEACDFDLCHGCLMKYFKP